MPVVDFGPIEVHYDETVLPPRPWTIAQSRWAAELATGPMLELGCGAGHIGLAAAVLSGQGLVQVDTSPVACAWAGANAGRAGRGDQVRQRLGRPEDVLGDDERFSVVIADPPYVSSDEVQNHPEDPDAAIDGGADGLGLVRRFVAVGAAHLGPGGSIVLQLGGPQQVEATGRWVRAAALGVRMAETRVLREDRALVRLTAKDGRRWRRRTRWS